jgi:hypothetical protein
MTPLEKEEQALSFAYGNLACSSHHAPVREAFKNVAMARGRMTEDEFEAWAEKLSWR